MIEKAKEIYKLVRSWFWALPMWKRAILSSFIGAIGGSSIIGFFNKYALYYHAICQNFRVPVEGVEYIDLAITLVSFAFISISIIGSITIYGALNIIADFFSKIIVRSKDKDRIDKWKKIIMNIQAIFTLILAIIQLVYRFLSKEPDIDIPNNPKIIIPFAVVIVVLVLGYIFSKNESSRKTFTLVVVSTGILLITASLFNQTVYKNFLKRIQYGGEIPIELEYRKADNTESTIKGALLIRTSKSVTIKDLLTNNQSEIPMERISKIIFLKEK